MLMVVTARCQPVDLVHACAGFFCLGLLDPEKHQVELLELGFQVGDLSSMSMWLSTQGVHIGCACTHVVLEGANLDPIILNLILSEDV